MSVGFINTQHGTSVSRDREINCLLAILRSIPEQSKLKQL